MNSSNQLPAPRKRGPKPKPAEEQLSQLTIRLTPKLKFGLELLARAQHRSLSQAVEWALQVGLNSQSVAKGLLGDLVDRAWEAQDEQRSLAIYRMAPELLEFEERAACDLIETCTEMEDVSAGLREEGKRNIGGLVAFKRFIHVFWPVIRQIAADRASSGKPTKGVSLIKAMRLNMAGRPLTDVMNLAVDALPTDFDPASWPELSKTINDAVRAGPSK